MDNVLERIDENEESKSNADEEELEQAIEAAGIEEYQKND